MVSTHPIRRRRTVARVALFIVPLVWGGAALAAQEPELVLERRSVDPDERITVRVERDQWIEVVAASSAFDPVITALLPDGQTISNDDYRGRSAGFERVITTSGELSIAVASLLPGEDGPWSLTVTRLAEPVRVAVGETVRREFTKANLGDARVADRFVVRGIAGQRVTVTASSDDFDPVLELRAVGGGTLANDDAFPGASDARIAYRFPQDGSVVVTVSSVFGDRLGAYRLDVTDGPGRERGTISEALSLDDPIAFDGTRFDVIPFDGRAGDRIALILESDAFDPVLWVHGPGGDLIASDDDGGGGTAAHVDLSLPETGQYTLYVTARAGRLGPWMIQRYE